MRHATGELAHGFHLLRLSQLLLGLRQARLFPKPVGDVVAGRESADLGSVRAAQDLELRLVGASVERGIAPLGEGRECLACEGAL